MLTLRRRLCFHSRSAKEWYLMLYINETLSHLRGNTSKAPHTQTSSKKVASNDVMPIISSLIPRPRPAWGRGYIISCPLQYLLHLHVPIGNTYFFYSLLPW